MQQRNPYEPPKAEVTISSAKEHASVRRGFWLSAYLVLAAIAAGFSLVAYTAFADTLLKQMLDLKVWGVRAFGAIAFLRILAVISIWRWSKSGVVLFAILTTIATALNIYFLGPINIYGLIGLVVLFLVVRSKWRYMSWKVLGQ